MDDDFRMGVVMLGMHDSRDEIPEVASTQQYVNSLPAPMQLGAAHKGKGTGNGKAEAPPPLFQAEF